jgi:protein-S-isoprenylcysteine O-methyltransferase Ste14
MPFEPDSRSARHRRPARSLFWRAIGAFIALPGVVAFLVPATIAVFAPRDTGFFSAGLVLLGLGVALLLWCVRDFYVAGKGTLAPWTPPRRLVVVGLYRYSRNPMYVAVTLILLGWVASFWSVYLLVYAAGVVAFFHLRVVFGEEPWLARLHGEAYEKYRASVPRWLL